MTKKLDRNYYDILEIERTADAAAIKKGYKKAALVLHPDKGGTDELFQMANEAFQVLNDPVKRSDYDKDLKKYNLKDGLPDPTGARIGKIKKMTSNLLNEVKLERQNTKEEEDKKESFTRTKTTKPAENVEIPSDLSALGVKELKRLLEALNVSTEDCFEKADMIAKITQLKEQRDPKRRASEATKPPSGFQRGNNKENSAPPPPKAKTFTPVPGAGIPKPENLTIKIVSVGNAEVGKSCLIKRYCEGRFVKRYISTIGIDYGVKKLNLKNYSVGVNFFDLSGAEDYKLIRQDFYADANGVIMVFDVDNRDSFNSLSHWEEEMRRFGIEMNRTKVVVCGNKIDNKGREVNTAEAQKWAKK